MSRIGKQPIIVPEGVVVAVSGGVVSLTGPKGTTSVKLPVNSSIALDENRIIAQAKESRVLGLTRSILANAVSGVTEGWSRVLELSGTGYRAAVVGSQLQLALGFSHPVTITAPSGIAFEVKDNKITVSGSDRVIIGQVASKIRSLRPADPYKAKGLKYDDEVVIKKPGKAAKAGGTAAAGSK